MALQNKKTKKCLASSRSSFPTMQRCNRSKHWWRVSHGEGSQRKKNFLVNRYHGYLFREAGGGIRALGSVWGQRPETPSPRFACYFIQLGLSVLEAQD
ncbi:hypothetical protein SMC26_16605 [Actinomadura fulvescens]|uniref:hypothetical protein n=1 Tax=Actinomadura fulvescens TaxID=46160 RepID=UPI0031D0779B